MPNYDFDRKKLKELDAIIDYFKLILLEKLTIDKDYSTFKLYDGENLFNKVINDSKERLISLGSTNFDLITSLNLKLDAFSDINDSVKEEYKDKVKNLDWIKDAIEDIKANDTAYDTLVNYASDDVNHNLLVPMFYDIRSERDDKKSLMERTDNIIEKSKSIN